jgi:hypothetical protein
MLQFILHYQRVIDSEISQFLTYRAILEASITVSFVAFSNTAASEAL